MGASFRVYCTDRIQGRHAGELPEKAMPVEFPTEQAALDFAFRCIGLDRIVWKVEYPDGKVCEREDLEFIYRSHPQRNPMGASDKLLRR